MLLDRMAELGRDPAGFEFATQIPTGSTPEEWRETQDLAHQFVGVGANHVILSHAPEPRDATAWTPSRARSRSRCGRPTDERHADRARSALRRHDGPVTDDTRAGPTQLPPDPAAYDSPRAQLARAKGLEAPVHRGRPRPRPGARAPGGALLREAARGHGRCAHVRRVRDRARDRRRDRERSMTVDAAAPSRHARRRRLGRGGR